MTKKLVIMGSANSRNFEKIVKYFKNKDVTIACLSDNKDSEILKKAQSLDIPNKYLPYESNTQYLASTDFDLIVLSGYNKKLAPETLKTGQVINIHPSLLPAFNCEDAIKRAYLTGVKVSGVTVYRVSTNVESETILAQYPVLIGLTTHFDEFEEEIHTLEDNLYPPVIEAVLEDRVFDFQDLLKNSCHNNNCGGCNGCNH